MFPVPSTSTTDCIWAEPGVCHVYTIIAPCTSVIATARLGTTFTHPLPRGFHSPGSIFGTEEAGVGEALVNVEASLRPQRGAKIPEDHGCGMRRLILPSHRTRITANSFTTLINLISNGTPTQCRSWGLHELGIVQL